MYYNSINNKLNVKKFINVFLNNIPKDKSLFFPFEIPKIKKNIIFSLLNKSYIDIAFFISKIFINDISDEILFNILKSSYENFNFSKIISIENLIKNNYILNLNYGSTLTFKDIAMKPLGNLLNIISNKIEKKVLIFCATSGDTGASAINNFKNFNNIKIFTFHPFNMISEIQRKQMTTLNNNNIKNISIIGNFDITQFFIKKIFENIKNKKKIFLSSVNSINWFRIIMQVVYYCVSSLLIFKKVKINYFIPTGNFGNSLSALIAKKLGFPINKINVCNNDNFYLDNFFKKKILNNLELKKTISPSIDISIPSNFKRIIFNNINNKNMNKINKNFSSDKILNKDIILSLEYFYLKYKKIYDPHTITSLTSLKNLNCNSFNVSVSTSYPIKFILSIKKILPNLKIKINLKKIFLIKEYYKIFPQKLNFILKYIINNL